MKKQSKTTCPLKRGDVNLPFPRPDWRRLWPVRALRFVWLRSIVFPTVRALANYSAEGTEHLEGLEPPVIFAANHSSHLDTPAALLATPPRWRKRVAPVITAEWFRPFLQPTGHSWSSRALRTFQYCMCCGGGNAMLIANCSCHLRQSLAYIEEQMRGGNCPLLFPEGARTTDGSIRQFYPGVGWLATRVEVPVVPIAIHGLFEIYPKHAYLPRRGRGRGRVRVRLARPIQCAPGDDYRALRAKVERAVCGLMEDLDRAASET
jgi:1-acyl-sn-glycerol-3-phosphate acyltransferase